MPPTTAERGYGAEHQRKREQWKPAVEAGGVNCAYEPCSEQIRPGTPWDLGHDDEDRSKYTGPEHRACNRRHKAKRAAERRQIGDPDPIPWTWT